MALSCSKKFAVGFAFVVLIGVLVMSVASFWAPQIQHALFPGAESACSIPTGFLHASAITGIATSVLGIAGLSYAVNRQNNGAKVFDAGWTEGMAKWALLVVILGGLALLFANSVTIIPGFLSSSLLMPGTAAFITIFALGGVFTLGGAAALVCSTYKADVQKEAETKAENALIALNAEIRAKLLSEGAFRVVGPGVFADLEGNSIDEDAICQLVAARKEKDAAEAKKAAGWTCLAVNDGKPCGITNVGMYAKRDKCYACGVDRPVTEDLISNRRRLASNVTCMRRLQQAMSL